MTLKLAYEKIEFRNKEYPIPMDSISISGLSAANVTAYIQIDSALISGNVVYPSVTVTLKGIPYSDWPYKKVLLTKKDFAQDTFKFRNNIYYIVGYNSGPMISISGNQLLTSASLTGIDILNPTIQV